MSSKRAIRRRSCGDKAKFDSIELARAAAARAKRRGHIVTPYKCEFCGGLHIGHPAHAGTKRKHRSSPS